MILQIIFLVSFSFTLYAQAVNDTLIKSSIDKYYQDQFEADLQAYKDSRVSPWWLLLPTMGIIADPSSGGVRPTIALNVTALITVIARNKREKAEVRKLQRKYNLDKAIKHQECITKLNRIKRVRQSTAKQIEEILSVKIAILAEDSIRYKQGEIRLKDILQSTLQLASFRQAIENKLEVINERMTNLLIDCKAQIKVR